MKYDITKPQAPKMPNLGNGTECIKILLSQTSKDMHEPLVPMLFPILGAHISGSDFQYPDLCWKLFCCRMALLMVKSGGGHNVFFIVQVVADLHPAIYNQKCRAKVRAMKTCFHCRTEADIDSERRQTINH